MRCPDTSANARCSASDASHENNGLAIAQKSESVLKDLGPDIKWEHSYVTGDKIYCVYTAPNAEMIREHAKRGGFPADSVEEVSSILDPSIGE